MKCYLIRLNKECSKLHETWKFCMNNKVLKLVMKDKNGEYQQFKDMFWKIMIDVALNRNCDYIFLKLYLIYKRIHWNILIRTNKWIYG